MTELSQLAQEKKEALRTNIAAVYGKPTADKMVDEFVPFATDKAVTLLGITQDNSDPELIEVALKSVTIAFNAVLKLHQPLPGKEGQRIEVQIL